MTDHAWGFEAVGDDGVRQLRFVQVDVFTDRMFGGNPLAVFLDGEDLSTEQMQAIALEMNLSETVFLLPTTRTDCDLRVRIFTPGQELPFAGHPTLGAAWVVVEHGIYLPQRGTLVLEEGIGPVRVDFRDDVLWMEQRPADLEPPLEDLATVAAMLGLDEADLHPDAPPRVGSTGNHFLLVALRDREAVDRVELDKRALEATLGGPPAIGVMVVAVDAGGAELPLSGGETMAATSVYTRMLPGRRTGGSEDPATGSASGPLGAYLVAHGLAPAADVVGIVSRQGEAMGRPSDVYITVRPDDGAIEVGGQVVPVLTGTLSLPADA